MTRENIAAYTPAQLSVGYVPYASLNKEEDGSIVLTVRNAGTMGSQIAHCPFTREELMKFATDIVNWLHNTAPPEKNYEDLGASSRTT